MEYTYVCEQRGGGEKGVEYKYVCEQEGGGR